MEEATLVTDDQGRPEMSYAKVAKYSVDRSAVPKITGTITVAESGTGVVFGCSLCEYVVSRDESSFRSRAYYGQGVMMILWHMEDNHPETHTS